VQFPTGGIAHEPQGMIRRNSGTNSKVWMKEDVCAKRQERDPGFFDPGSVFVLAHNPEGFLSLSKF